MDIIGCGVGDPAGFCGTKPEKLHASGGGGDLDKGLQLGDRDKGCSKLLLLLLLLPPTKEEGLGELDDDTTLDSEEELDEDLENDDEDTLDPEEELDEDLENDDEATLGVKRRFKSLSSLLGDEGTLGAAKKQLPDWHVCPASLTRRLHPCVAHGNAMQAPFLQSRHTPVKDRT
jgi:hypothetical protein